jgi:hypothetical protein
MSCGLIGHLKTLSVSTLYSVGYYHRHRKFVNYLEENSSALNEMASKHMPGRTGENHEKSQSQ